MTKPFIDEFGILCPADFTGNFTLGEIIIKHKAGK